MMTVIIIILAVLIFGGILYWAYLPDYRQNPREFWRTLIGMPIGMLLAGLGFRELDERIKKWALSKTPKGKSKK